MASSISGLLGKGVSEVREALGAMKGIATIRIATPGAPMTRDYRADRVTVVQDGDTVRAILCG